MRRRAFLLFLGLLLTLSLSCLVPGTTGLNPPAGQPFNPLEIDFPSFHASINVSNVGAHLRYLTGQGSRMTGYPGCENATEYVYSYFQGLRSTAAPEMSVTYHNFTVTVPIDYGSNLTLLGANQSFRIYAMEPNVVCPVTTGPEGITGHLVYVGTGSLGEMDGQPINGSIALLDYNSGTSWRTLAEYGARAAVFIEPKWTTYEENDRKSISQPHAFPRFYMPSEEKDALVTAAGGNSLTHIAELATNGTPLTATLRGHTWWENRLGRNVVAILPAPEDSPQRDNVTVISAHLDSNSPVLSVAPGANDALGVSILMELARLFTQPEFRPLYTVMFVAFSGHYQSLSGPRHFVDDYWYGGQAEKDYATDVARKVILWLGIQPSTLADELALQRLGRFYISNNVEDGAYSDWPRVDDFQNYTYMGLMSAINDQLGTDFRLLDWLTLVKAGAGTNEPGIIQPLGGVRRWSDADPFNLNGGAAFTVVSRDDDEYIGSPIDTYERLNLRNLERNVNAACCLFYGWARTPRLQSDEYDLDPIASRGQFYDNLREPLNLRGQTVMYNSSIARYEGADAIVAVKLAWGADAAPVGEVMFTRRREGEVDPVGWFNFPIFSSGSGGGRQHFRAEVLAFRLDNATGQITHSPVATVPALGREVEPPRTRVMKVSGDYNIGRFNMMECSTMILLTTAYPHNLGTFGVGGRSLRVLDHEIQIPVDDYWVSQDMSVVAVPPNVTVDLLLATPHLGNIPMGFLINASEENPEGTGFRFTRAGEQLTLPSGPIGFSRDLHYVNKIYIDKLQVIQIGVEYSKKNDWALANVTAALEAQNEGNYSEAMAIAFKAWANVQKLYTELRSTIVDTSTTVVYFGILVLPFAFLVEMLFFSSMGKKRIAVLVSLYAATVIVFYLIHPGFRLAANAFMIVMGLAALLLTMPLAGLLFASVSASIQRLAKRVRGVHFAEMSRWSAMMLAFSSGVQNMRRRRMRTGLTLTTIILVVIAIVLFTSVSSISIVEPKGAGRDPAYNGVMIKRTDWVGSIGTTIIDVLKGRYEAYHYTDGELVVDKAVILPRAWLYTEGWRDPFEPPRGALNATNPANGKTYTFYAIWGLTPEEKYLWNLEQGMETPRWLLPEDDDVCIISSLAARELNVTSGGKINFLYRDITVVGVIDETVVKNLRDLDRELGITPLDEVEVAGGEERTLHRDPEDIIIMPYRNVIRNQVSGDRFKIASVVAWTGDNDTIAGPRAEAIGRELFTDFGELELLVGNRMTNRIVYFTTGVSLTVFGWQMEVIPIALSSLMILNVMIGSVKEREREIFTLSSVGLSPLHVSLMFLAEAAVYAVIGATLGYILAMSIMTLGTRLGAVAVSANYSTGWVVTSIGLAMLLTVVSVLYPMRKASTLVTPSLERAWKIPTKPAGDEWGIPFPVVIPSDEEATGLCAYLSEFLEVHTGEAEVFSLTNLAHEEGEGLKRLVAGIRLEPYERGVAQRAQISLIRDPQTKAWNVEVHLRKMTGELELWTRANRAFLDGLRKQFLMWRALTPKERLRYIKGE